MTAAKTRLRAAAAAVAREGSCCQQNERKDHTKKRKRSDLDQEISGSEANPHLLKASPQYIKDGNAGSEEYSGPYPQHVRPTSQECQVRQDHIS